MITGTVKSEKPSPNSVEVLWTIEKLDKKLTKEDDILRSIPIYFAGQMWQPLLTTVGILEDLLIDFSISRITVCTDKTPNSSVVCWSMGILDSNGRSHYGRTGFACLDMVFDWMTVVYFSGPEFTDLCLQNNLYMPGDKITIALRLILDFSYALKEVRQYDEEFADEGKALDKEYPTQILEGISRFLDVVAINVRDKTFYAEGSILHGISHDIERKIFEWQRGRTTVIDLHDCDPDAFECFLSFAHSREIKGLTDGIARKVYHIADKFQVPELKRECVQRFLRNLNVSSVCGFLEMAESYHDQALKEECSEFFLKNAQDILNTSEWLEFLAKRTKFANDLIRSCFNSIA